MAKHPGGRPSKYKPEYCQALIEHMSQGLSYDSFGAAIDVNDDTLYEWEKRHPEFSDAKRLGRQKQKLTFQKIGMNAALGKITNFNATAFVWMSKNMLGWTDRQDIQLTGRDGGPIEVSNQLQFLSTEKLIEVYDQKKLAKEPNLIED